MYQLHANHFFWYNCVSVFVCLHRMSGRIINLYDSRNLSKELCTVQTSATPSLLIPFYDEDSSVLFLNGKVSTCGVYMVSL